MLEIQKLVLNPAFILFHCDKGWKTTLEQCSAEVAFEDEMAVGFLEQITRFRGS